MFGGFSAARRWQLSLLIGSAAVLVPLSVLAVSDGDYSYQQQGCTANADQFNRTDAESGCHNARVVISDGSGHQLASAGTFQTQNGQPVSSGDYSLTPTAADPTSGVKVYFGADDNLDEGEHDGATDWHNGPSDGGGVHANATPGLVMAWLGGLMAAAAGHPQYFLTHPLPVDAGYGACADGTCASVQTERHTAFQGGSHGGRDAADYSGVTWDPYNCSSGDAQSDSKSACGGHTLRWWNQRQGAVYVEPGAQVYEDPDAQASPALPVYPIPAAYVGTCGVVAGGGPVTAPASPVTNSAGQVAIQTGC